ncbi:hypothetical protein BJX70DRAFT_404729 [Aspergillus crustosus]
MRLTSLVAFLPLFYPLVSASELPTPLDAPIPGYRIWSPEWEFEVSPNKTITTRGTVEEAYALARQHNPNLDAEYLTPTLAEAQRELELDAAATTLNRLNKRWARKKVYCNTKRWSPVDMFTARRLVNNVMKMNGRPTLGPGKGECGRVSCHNGGGLWWCNDNLNTKTLSDYKELSQGANIVIAECATDAFGSGVRVKGQAFNNANWNVIIRKDGGC